MSDRSSGCASAFIRGVACLIAAVALCACSVGPGSPAPPASPASAASSATNTGLKLLVLGDSIPNNSSEDCPGCTGFANRYAAELEEATGRPVELVNLSEHNNLTLPDLLGELPSLELIIASADVIVVGIAHNSFVLNSDRPCGTTIDEKTDKPSDWSKINARCANTAAEKYRPPYEKLFTGISSLRSGKPTVFRTINRYNDWIGWKEGHLTRDQEHRTTVLLDAWNTMLCRAAEDHGFGCTDVYHAFNGADGDRASGDRLAKDYIHPSDKGNATIAKVLVAQGYAPLR